MQQVQCDDNELFNVFNWSAVKCVNALLKTSILTVMYYHFELLLGFSSQQRMGKQSTLCSITSMALVHLYLICLSHVTCMLSCIAILLRDKAIFYASSSTSQLFVGSVAVSTQGQIHQRSAEMAAYDSMLSAERAGNIISMSFCIVTSL